MCGCVGALPLFDLDEGKSLIKLDMRIPNRLFGSNFTKLTLIREIIRAKDEMKILYKSVECEGRDH